MARDLFNKRRTQRQIQVFSSFDASEKMDRRDWMRMSPRTRLETVELLRQMNHADYDPAARRLPRLYTVAKSEAR